MSLECHRRRRRMLSASLSVAAQTFLQIETLKVNIDDSHATQSAVVLPAPAYAASGAFSVNLWQRMHTAATGSAMYLFSHQPEAFTQDAWGANQVFFLLHYCRSSSDITLKPGSGQVVWRD